MGLLFVYVVCISCRARTYRVLRSPPEIASMHIVMCVVIYVLTYVLDWYAPDSYSTCEIQYAQVVVTLPYFLNYMSQTCEWVSTGIHARSPACGYGTAPYATYLLQLPTPQFHGNQTFPIHMQITHTQLIVQYSYQYSCASCSTAAMQHTCSSPAAYLRFTRSIPAVHLQYTGSLRVHSCMLTSNTHVYIPWSTHLHMYHAHAFHPH